jgi:hypothetical protein
VLGPDQHFLQALGIPIPRGAQPQLDRRDFADAVAVHRHLRGARRGNDGEALGLQLGEHFGADRLDFWHDIIGPMLLHRGAQQLAVEHREDLEIIGHLHRRGACIGVARDHMGAEPLGRDHELAAELARAEEQDLRRERHVLAFHLGWRVTGGRRRPCPCPEGARKIPLPM